MPETRRQVVLEIISFGMFDDYYSNIPPSRRELRQKDLRKILGRVSQRLLTLSYTPLLSL